MPDALSSFERSLQSVSRSMWPPGTLRPSPLEVAAGLASSSHRSPASQSQHTSRAPGDEKGWGELRSFQSHPGQPLLAFRFDASLKQMHPGLQAGDPVLPHGQALRWLLQAARKRGTPEGTANV